MTILRRWFPRLDNYWNDWLRIFEKTYDNALLVAFTLSYQLTGHEIYKKKVIEEAAQPLLRRELMHEGGAAFLVPHDADSEG